MQEELKQPKMEQQERQQQEARQEEVKQDQANQERVTQAQTSLEEVKQEQAMPKQATHKEDGQYQVEAAAHAGEKVGEHRAAASGESGRSAIAGVNVGTKTKEEVIAGIRELAERMGRRPQREQVCRELGISVRRIKRLFGTYRMAMKAVQLTGVTAGRLTMEELFEDWRAVVRALGKIPGVKDYQKKSRYSERPLKDRFGSWTDVQGRMLEFGSTKSLFDGYDDVKTLAEQYMEETTQSRVWNGEKTYTREDVDVDMIYGEPLCAYPMANAPINEDGVLVLFGMMARQLNFVVLRIRGKYPDGEVLRRLPDGTWIRLRIEFEFLSRNFAQHGHDPAKCDLIVCWENNWPECPVEVLELKQFFGKAFSF